MDYITIAKHIGQDFIINIYHYRRDFAKKGALVEAAYFSSDCNFCGL